MPHTLSLLCAAPAVLAAGCSLSAEPEPGPNEPTASSSEGVIRGSSVSNASNPGAVAVYHQITEGRRTSYWPRPCSGTVLKIVDGTTWVLTARHCVTTNGDVSGPVGPASGIQVSNVVDPGLADPNPPSSALPVLDVRATKSTAYDSHNDVALLQVDGELKFENSAGNWTRKARLALDFRSFENGLTGLPLTSYGYGRKVVGEDPSDPSTEDGTTGAGRLRRGNFTIGSVLPHSEGGAYTFFNPVSQSSGTAIYSGDSGGPATFKRMATDGTVTVGWRTIVGVHAQVNTGLDTGWDTMVLGQANFIQKTLGYVYVSPLVSKGENMVRLTGGRVSIAGRAEVAAQHMYWNANNETIVWAGGSTATCLEPENKSHLGGTRLDFATCDGSIEQRWWLLSNGQIQNQAVQEPEVEVPPGTLSSGCASVTGNNTVVLAACDAGEARQTWAWHAQY